MITRAKILAVRAAGVRYSFEGGAYQLFCPRCGAYSRAALIRVNSSLTEQCRYTVRVWLTAYLVLSAI